MVLVGEVGLVHRQAQCYKIPDQTDPLPAAKVLARVGGLKGGKARAEALTPDERQRIARQAATARWVKAHDRGQKILKATHGSPDRPLRIGPIEIPCYVLEGGKRVVVQGGMIGALGMGKGGQPGGYRLANFVTGKLLNPFVSQELSDGIQRPIFFRAPNGRLAYGYEATILAEICEAVLKARQAGVLRKHQLHIAERCEILVRGFARVGIIALVDEATGYQEDRDRQELQKILEAYVAKELLPWTKRFPDDFFKHLFRLRGWAFDFHKGPRRVAQDINYLVYDHFPPGVMPEVRRRNPIVSNGRRRHKLHRWLTDEKGVDHLEKHVAVVTTLMRISPTWQSFQHLFLRAFPLKNRPVQLEMLSEEEELLDAEFSVVEGK